MRYDILIILLNLFVSIADFTPTTENECKPTANDESTVKRLETERVETALRHYITCGHDVWSRSDAIETNLHFIMRPRFARFDEDSGKLGLLSWVVVSGMDERLKWNETQFSSFGTWFEHPDLLFMSLGTDDIFERGANHTWCHLSIDGSIACGENMHQTIRCQTDLTFWPYDRHTCTITITSWLFTSGALNLSDIYQPVYMFDFKPDGRWNLSVSRITYEQRKLVFFDNVIYPQMSIEFILDRLHTQLRRRFVVPAVIMMIMTLTALWLEPKSYERLAVASMNIVIHMMCILDLHWVLPRNGITVPNMLLFYINSFVLATIVLPLTFLLRKMKVTNTSVPKWISANIDRLLRSKTGHVLLLVMLDPKVMAEIETRADDNSGVLSSELKEFTWKYMAIFFGWISFFSFFSAYILMYILLIPDAASRPPIMSIV